MPKRTASKKTLQRPAEPGKDQGPAGPREEPKEEIKEWLNPSEAMKYLGISRTALYKLMNDGLLPYYSIKGLRKRRLKKEDLDALMEKGGGSELGER